MTDRDAADPADGAEEQPSNTDADSSLFADLLDRVEEQQARSRWTDRGDDSGSQEAGDDARTESKTTAIDSVRERLSEELPPVPTRPGVGRNNEESSENRILYTGVILGVVLAIVVPGMVGVVVGHVDDTYLSPAPGMTVSANDTIYLQTDDASYLTRIFRETSHEVPYCGLISDDQERPTLEIWMADTVSADPERVRFITENCPNGVQEVLLHTHPNGVLRPSAQDIRTIEERPEQFLCIQGGPLVAEPGSEVENLACYREVDDRQSSPALAQMEVVMDPESSIIG